VGVVSQDRYSFFRIDAPDYTHDITIHLQPTGTSPQQLDLSDSPLAAHAAADLSPRYSLYCFIGAKKCGNY
jgi:hypothetical protein